MEKNIKDEVRILQRRARQDASSDLLEGKTATGDPVNVARARSRSRRASSSPRDVLTRLRHSDDPDAAA